MEKNIEVVSESVDLTGRDSFALSHAIRRGNHLYISGQVPRDKANNLVGENDLEAQCVQVYENIKSIVMAAGGDMKHIVDTLVVVTDNSYKAVHTEVRKRYFQTPYPACTTIIAGLSPGYMIEINAVAILDD
jgi:enamine deaminase RidA (YjgF/YER057c/UK114 family)